MNFLSPIAFLFAATLPVVVVFYLLKRKRVVKRVPSTILWQKFLAETQASAPFQRLRHNWLLLIQLLLLLIAILALARPYFAGQTKGGRILVSILDGSASMQSTDETPSRFEKSRHQALQLVKSLHPDDKMVVLLAAGSTEVKQSPTSEKAALRRAIESAQPSDSPTRLHDAVKLAETLIQNNVQAEIHLFSDGATDSLSDFENKGLPVVYHQAGTRHVNVGIVNLDVRSNPDNPAQRAVFATLLNASTNRQQVQAELVFDDKVVGVKSLDLKPKESSPQVFIAEQPHDGVFTLRLDVKDDLAVDNTASVVSLLPQPIKVLLVTAGNRFLEKALRSVPAVELAKTAQLSDAAGFDLVVLDNVTAPVLPKANIIAINVVHTNWFPGWKRLEAPPIVDWKGSHALLRFVNFDNVQIAESYAVQTPSWALGLVESPNTPLVLAGELNRQRLVWIGFDTLQSTWPLRISFPIFIANAVEWLNPASEKASSLSIRAGDPLRLALAENASSAEILLPDGSTRNRAVDANRHELLFGETQKQGIYKVTAGTNQMIFCVNLLDGLETDTTPRNEIQFGAYAKVSSTTTRQANLEVWRWFALAALVLLFFEWWYYHRRTA
ncbi:MAG TPA: VWA domain-containing protein [Verrucomicrobiae bacterium]|nr:VWA domain-containing protein [Verrucomicrobiae bacterium]